MSEDPGVSNSEIRSIASCGISMRSRAVLALFGVGGTVPVIPGPLCNFCEVLGLRGDFSGIETTVQRIVAPILKFHCAKNVCSNWLLLILDFDRDIEQGREALSHEELVQRAAHKD